MANTKGQIFGINGPVVKVKGSDSFEMQEMVYVGNEELIGEVIGVTSDTTIVQVYEETTGLKKGEPDRYLSFGRYRFYGFFVHSQPLFRGFAGVADAGKDGCHTGNGAGGCAGVSGLAVCPA